MGCVNREDSEEGLLLMGQSATVLHRHVLRRASQFITQAALFPFHTRKNRGPEKLIDPPIIIQLGNR